MRMLQCLKRKVILLAIVSLIVLAPIRSTAEDEYLIVRIMDADYPIRANMHEDENLTGFTVTMDIQIENPSSSPIIVPFVCAPFPFPYLRTNLRDKSLKVFQSIYIEWVAGEYAVQSGIKNETYKFYFEIDNYVNDSLPIGNYKMWFDYTNCSLSPVPVITEKMYIDVTETSVTYYFDWNNTSRIVSPKITLEVNYLLTSLITTFFLVSLVIKSCNLKKKKVDHYNH
ncbi:MAG: hypothetical protein HGN29_09975 [Asgard group archaeon]|nr:hypothetical protein [Asgard group archaeon]